MTVFKQVVWGWITGLAVAGVLASHLFAAEAYPVFTDINMTAGNFTEPWAGPFGAYTVDTAATLNGNAVLGITQNEMTACCHGTSVVVAVSNGENGDDGSPDMVDGMPNMDPPNTTPANSVFNTIGNASGKLEDGNVVRLSAWFRSDPANPIEIEPQVAPILKIEYWKQGLGGTGDTTGNKIFPDFGDRMFDQDQQGYPIGIADPPAYVDIDHDDTVLHEAGITPASGRLFGLSTDEWTLASVTHTVNVADWFGIGAAGYGMNDVTKIESIQGVIFMGEFSTVAVAGPGTLLVDNLLIEVFKDSASVTPLSNPDPALSEMTGLQGDFSGNNSVENADLTLLLNNWAQPATPVPAGWIGSPQPTDPAIDNDELTALLNNWGQSVGSGSGPTNVPEPACWILGAVAACAIGMLRRRA